MQVIKECELLIITKTNLQFVNFLDIELDLMYGTHRPYRKPNDNPMFINTNSNHLRSIKKKIPKSISKKISKLSSNKEVFNNNIKTYSDAF